MSSADQSISLMDGTYFVGRKEILDWLNALCGLSLSKVEQTCTGAVACQILDAIYPGKVPMSKVDWSANKDYEYIQNYKVLQKCFSTLKIDKHIEVDRLIRGKYQDNLEFMQWYKKFYELNASGAPYDPIAQREKGKGGAQYTQKFGGAVSGGGAGSAPSPTPAVARKKSAPAAATTATRTTRPPGAPSALGATRGAKTSTATRRPVGSAGSTAAAAPVVDTAHAAQLEAELEETRAANETLTNENGELRLMVRCGVNGRGERPFYSRNMYCRWRGWKRNGTSTLASCATLRFCCKALKARTQPSWDRQFSRFCTRRRRNSPLLRAKRLASRRTRRCEPARSL